MVSHVGWIIKDISGSTKTMLIFTLFWNKFKYAEHKYIEAYAASGSVILLLSYIWFHWLPYAAVK